jgi:hypothetical protein
MTRCKSEITMGKGKKKKVLRCCLKATDTHKRGHVSSGYHWPLTDPITKKVRKYKPSLHERWLGELREDEKRKLPDNIKGLKIEQVQW